MSETLSSVPVRQLDLDLRAAKEVARDLKDDQIQAGVSHESIARAAGRIEEMTRGKLPARQPKLLAIQNRIR